MNPYYLRGYAERADGESSDGPVRFVAATEGRKEDGINLRMDHLDLSRFTSNPVVMYGHDYAGREALPIGRAEAAVDGSRLLADVTFDSGDEFASTVERKVRGGFLNAVSVGFDMRDVDEEGVPAQWSLFEISVVPIPLDSNATVESGRDLALARAIGDLRAGKVLSDKNFKLVQEAAQALSAILEAAQSATSETSSDDEEGRGTPRVDAARLKLRLHELMSA